MNYSNQNQYFTQNTGNNQYNTNVPCQSRSSYSLQQYYNNNNTATATNPQLLGQSRSLSHSNLRSYYNRQQRQRPATGTAVPSMNNRCVSHPQPRNAGNVANANSGIVLQTLSSNTAIPPKPAMNRTKNLSDNNMTANLQQFAKYSQLQLQQVLSRYPAWLQKEYMRRLQRQYEELYVVEDPKIHHWSAICPRKADSAALTPAPDENSCLNIISDSCEYLSESATLSPSPYAYSPHHGHVEDTTSPAAPSHNKNIETLSISLTPPPPPQAAQAESRTDGDGDRSKMLTCFAILDYIEKEEKLGLKVKVPAVAPIAVDRINEKFDILVEDEEDCESESEEVHDNADNVQSPKDKEQRSCTQEQVQNGYHSVNSAQYQQYQQAMQRYYQQKQFQQQYLMQQALHQQYLMRQNKFVNRYVTQQQQQPQAQQKQNYVYYQSNVPTYQNNAHFCA